MGDRERGHDQHQRAQSPQWNYQAKQEQQVVRPVEDMLETELDESPGGLEPARI